MMATRERDPSHYKRYKMLQEFLIEFFMVFVVFNAVSSLISLSKNKITSSLEFMAAVLVGVILLLCYIGYFIASVRKLLVFELYKVNNVVRAICLAFMCVNSYAGLIILLIAEVIFILVDWRIYREHKINKKTYIVDRLAMLAILVAAALVDTLNTTIIVFAVFLAVLYLIKGYYLILRIREYIEERKLREISDGSVSEVVNNSVKGKEDEGEYHDAKEFYESKNNNSSLKLNNDDTLLYNESLNQSRV